MSLKQLELIFFESIKTQIVHNIFPRLASYLNSRSDKSAPVSVEELSNAAFENPQPSNLPVECSSDNGVCMIKESKMEAKEDKEENKEKLWVVV